MKDRIDAILVRVVPWWARDAVLGDLEEEFRLRAARSGRGAATRWYAREALSLAIRYGIERWRTAPDLAAPPGSRRDGVMTDLRHALRGLARSPGFALAATLTLAIGMAANVSVYALIDAVLFRPISSFEPERLVRLGKTAPNVETPKFGFSYVDFREIQSESRTLTDVAASSMTPFVMRVGENSSEILGEVVSGSYFPMIRVVSGHGRLLGPDDDRQAAPPVAVISERASQRHFAGREAIGATIFLNGGAFTVVGVAPPEFGGTFVGAPIDAWLCTESANDFFSRDWRSDRSLTQFSLFARLRPGVTREQAQGELDTLSREMARLAPAPQDPPAETRLRVLDGDLLRGGQRQAALMFALLLSVLVALVLLIVCANVANLLLARGMSLRRQIAIRQALGAGRWRLVSLVMIESMALATLGGIGALAIAAVLMRALSTFAPLPTLTIDLGLRLETGTVLTAGLVALVTGALLGIMPALHATRPDMRALREESRAVAGGRRTARVRATLVVAQIAVSVLLLSSAGLFLKSVANARRLDLGFEPRTAMAIDINVKSKSLSPTEAHRIYDELRERLQTRSDVVAVAFSNRAPVDFSAPSVNIIIGDRGAGPNEQAPSATMYLASPDYFDAVSIPILQGRPFRAGDDRDAPPVAIVNQTMAERFWPGEEAIGRTFRTGPMAPPIQIVGIAKNSRYKSLGEEPAPHVYLPFAQSEGQSATLIVKAAQDPRPLLSPVQRELERLSTPLQGFFARTLTDHLQIYHLPSEIAATMAGALSVVALLIAAVGLYGLIAYMVGQRTTEIAIRIALGARPQQIRGEVLGSGLRLLVPGLAIGLLGAAGVGTLASSLLHEVGPADPLSMSAAAIALTVVAISASYLPARRAMRVDPADVLRC